MDDTMRNMPAIPNDGWDGETEEDRSGIIRGGKLKFTNEYEWLCDGEVIPPGREFIALETAKMAQKWVPWSKGPVETIVLGAGEPWPNIEEMNAEAPREEWQEKFSQLKGPWQKARVLYLLHPETMGVFTYIATTDGGMRAVRELRERARIARKLRGQVLAVVTLGNTFMPTQYGGRQRPDFKVGRYVPFGDPEPKQLAHAGPDDGKPKQDNGGALIETAAPKKPKSKQPAKASVRQTSFLDDKLKARAKKAAPIVEDEENLDLDEAGEDDLRIQAEEDALERELIGKGKRR